MRLTDAAWVEVNAAGQPLTIFKNQKLAILAGVQIAQMLYGVAVENIRRAVFVRDNYKCTHCGKDVTWGGPARGHLHERQWRGKGGLISLENSTTLCSACHSDDPIAGHGKRKPQWSSPPR